jgi:hypothetical protein
MATSTTEFRNLIANYKAITSASRAAGNADPAILGQLQGLQSSLAPYVAEGYSAGGYDSADTISNDVAGYITLIEQNIAAGKTPTPQVFKESELNKPKVIGEVPPDDAITSKSQTLSNNTDAATTSSSLAPDGTPLQKEVASNTDANSKPNKRQYNPLSKFSSVTYKLSLYAITPDAYNSFYENDRWITKDLELIVQSAGVSKELDSPRNKYFEFDFGIDDLEITTLTNAKETSTAGNQSDFKFKLYEPYGMTFPSRLVKAEVDLQQRAGIKRSIAQQTEALMSPFLLVVRFYGYDSNGNPVTEPVDDGVSGTKTDTNAAFERAFPIVITKLTFKMENKVTVYDVTAKLMNEQVGLGVKRGVVKTGFSISADTVEAALGGKGSGLFDKINEQQKSITNKSEKEKKQMIDDDYNVVFQPESGIGEALLVDKDFYVKNFAPMASGPSNVRTSQGPSATTVSKGKRTIKIAEGTPILTAIDQIITQSTYLRDAMKVFDKEEVQEVQENDESFNENANPKKLYWYNVRTHVKIKGFDEIRQDFAYSITYIIQKYQIPYVRSLVTGAPTTYYGPHKIYKYWYSGENTEVLNYEMQYNLLYYLTSALSSDAANNKPANKTPNNPGPGQGADPTGKLPGKFELQNELKTFLYSPGDQVKAQIKILGDPDYLMPTEAGSITTSFKQWYGEDYTINASSGQVFIEIGFSQVEDYDNTTGILKPNENIMFWDYPAEIEKMTQGRMVYMLMKVVSKFSRGVFTQDLKTILPNFGDKKNTKDDPSKRDDKTKTTTDTRKTTPAEEKVEPAPALAGKSFKDASKEANAAAAAPATFKSVAPSDDYVDTTPKPSTATPAPSQEREAPTNKESWLSKLFGSGQNAGKGRGSQGR